MIGETFAATRGRGVGSPLQLHSFAARQTGHCMRYTRLCRCAGYAHTCAHIQDIHDTNRACIDMQDNTYVYAYLQTFGILPSKEGQHGRVSNFFNTFLGAGPSELDIPAHSQKQAIRAYAQNALFHRYAVTTQESHESLVSVVAPCSLLYLCVSLAFCAASTYTCR